MADGEQDDQGEHAGIFIHELDAEAQIALDEELLAASYLGEYVELEQLLGVARLSRTVEHFNETLANLLFSAANTGNENTFNVLCNFGVDVNMELNNGQDTVLHVAARYNAAPLVDPLIKRGVHISKRNTSGCTALDIACQGCLTGDRKAFVQELVRVIKGRRIEVDEDFAYTALTSAIESGDIELVRLLLLTFPDSINLNLHEDAGTPLHVACENDSVPMVDLLVSAGGEVEAVTTLAMVTPLMRAAEYGHVPIMRRLLDLGVELDRQTEEASSALIMACHFGQTEAVSFLLEKNANPRQKNRWGFSPLFMGADNPDIIRVLTAYEVDLDELCGERGEAAIHLSAVVGSREGVRLMLDMGANINNTTSVQETILWLAAWKCHVDVARLVLQLNCDKNIPSNGCQVYKWDYTPLEIAIGKECFPIAKMMLLTGCNIRNPVYFKENEKGPSKAIPWLRLRPEILQIAELRYNTRFFRWLTKFLTTPRSLKDLCRICVRNGLGSSVLLEKKVAKLHVPQELRRDLLFSDLQNIKD